LKADDSVRGRNLILIGMPGAGKSTIGRCLARMLAWPFIDTDDLIEKRWGRSLQEIIDEEGLQVFAGKEEAVILDLNPTGHVVATGGSVVYYPAAMAHLRKLGLLVWLDVPLDDIQRRLIGATDDRGLLIQAGQTLTGLFRERQPFYQRYADLRIAAQGKTTLEIVREIRDYWSSNPDPAFQ